MRKLCLFMLLIFLYKISFIRSNTPEGEYSFDDSNNDEDGEYDDEDSQNDIEKFKYVLIKQSSGLAKKMENNISQHTLKEDIKMVIYNSSASEIFIIFNELKSDNYIYDFFLEVENISDLTEDERSEKRYVDYF